MKTTQPFIDREANRNMQNREAVQRQSPGSRSAPWEMGTAKRFNNIARRIVGRCATPLENLPGVATSVFGVKRLWRWNVAIIACVLAGAFLANGAFAHDGHSHTPSAEAKKKIVRVNTEMPKHHFVVFQNATAAPELAKIFDPFKNTVNVEDVKEQNAGVKL